MGQAREGALCCYSCEYITCLLVWMVHKLQVRHVPSALGIRLLS